MQTRFFTIRILLIFLLSGVLQAANAQAVYGWAKHFTNIDELTPSGITVDASGNVYTTGYFSNHADFDPGTGTQILTANGDNDVYITKSDANGNLLWAKSVGGAEIDNSWAIKADAAGNVYVTGFFRGAVDFDPGPGVAILTGPASSIRSDVFILKLDALGNYIWAKSLAGNSIATVNGITIDGTGNVYTTGNFSGIVDFDPGAGAHPINAGTTNSIFILKLDVDGNYIWAKNVVSSGVDGNEGRGIAVDASGNVYTTGFFSGTADFDPGAGTVNFTTVHHYDIYILKLNEDGDYVWAKQIGANDKQMGYTIAVDATGNVYTSGSFNGTVDFDPGADVHTLASNGAEDVYVCKLDASGNYEWAVSVGGSNIDLCQTLALDNLGNVYITGGFTSVTDFDPGTGVVELTPAGAFDTFILKLDAAGAYRWAIGLGGSGNEAGVSLVVTGDDNIYTTGVFENTIDLDPGTGTQNVTTPDWGVYILHLIPGAPLPLTLLRFTATDKETAVQLHWQTSQEENTASFTIERSADGKQYTAIGSVVAASNYLVNNYSFTDGQPLAGNAIYRLKMIDKDARFTHSPIVVVKRNGRAQPLQVSPNPVTDRLYVQTTGTETVLQQIADATGRIWQQQHITLNGKTSFSVNINSLPAGVYYLVVKGKHTHQVQQFIKQ